MIGQTISHYRILEKPHFFTAEKTDKAKEISL